jgi:hypothetical protein
MFSDDLGSTDLTGCGKTPKLSFRGRCLPEESAFPPYARKQIPRFARDDNLTRSFRNLFRLSVFGLARNKPHRQKSVLLEAFGTNCAKLFFP